MSLTVAIIAPGNMGAGIGKRLTEYKATVRRVSISCQV